MNPASPEHNAPNTNARAIIPWSLELYPIKSNTATTATNIANTLYSLLRKAIAPLRMWPAILAISSVPWL